VSFGVFFGWSSARDNGRAVLNRLTETSSGDKLWGSSTPSLPVSVNFTPLFSALEGEGCLPSVFSISP